jgi:predicted RNA-binding protein with RPS1 domain
VTVVVDATFGHRIDKRERAEFDSGISNNELVTPPAGAVGRGDGFVLTIAKKVGANVVSNDSYQEFQDEHPWLFDDGRLIGGKPVPHVGWVFIARSPVRATGTAVARRTRAAAKETRKEPTKETVRAKPVAKAAAKAASRAPDRPPAKSSVNELAPFLDFVERHPVGSKVKGVVERYAAHGAYVTLGDVRGYLPLRAMGDPPPRSAREHLDVGQAVTVTVETFVPARRSIDVRLVAATERKAARAPKKAAKTKAAAKKK